MAVKDVCISPSPNLSAISPVFSISLTSGMDLKRDSVGGGEGTSLYSCIQEGVQKRISFCVRKPR